MAYTAGLTEERDVLTLQARAGAAFAPYTILAKGTDEDEVINATSGADYPIGVASNASENNAATYVEDDPVVVKYSGIVYVKLGGTVVRDGALIATTAGVAIAIGNTTDIMVVGHAMKAGVSGDIIPMLINRYYVSEDMTTL